MALHGCIKLLLKGSTSPPLVREWWHSCSARSGIGNKDITRTHTTCNKTKELQPQVPCIAIISLFLNARLQLLLYKRMLCMTGWTSNLDNCVLSSIGLVFCSKMKKLFFVFVHNKNYPIKKKKKDTQKEKAIHFYFRMKSRLAKLLMICKI